MQHLCGQSIEEVWRIDNFLQVEVTSIWEGRKCQLWIFFLEAFEQLHDDNNKLLDTHIYDLYLLPIKIN